MNKLLYRIIFNKTRGQVMAVAENASADGKQAAAATSRVSAVAVRMRPLCWSIMVALGLAATVSNAQIVADPGAPGTQRPTVLNTANGMPLVNIQTPSAAGVSRNTYRQFDVGGQGAILNNSRTNIQTQLGGWVEGNPWLATGSARVILNEVNSNDPSRLLGYVEVAGQRAQVVIANPAGITCEGCGFINANRATLTTGTPILNGGSLDGYRISGGMIDISGAGLDTRDTDYTDVIARAVQINAGIWANTLKVSTGANEVSADHTQIQAIAGNGPAPAFGIDVAALGGMYAGKIMLVGTEAGVGMRNAGEIGASADEVVVTADGKLQNSGRITASTTVRVDTNGGIANSGTLYAQGDAQLSTRGDVDNTGAIAAQGNTSIAATGASSRVTSYAGSVIGAGVQADGTLAGSSAVQVSATGQLTAQGQNLASGDLSLAGSGVNVIGSQTGARNVSLNAGSGDVDASRARVDASGTLSASASASLRTDGATVSAQQLMLAAHDLFNVGGEVIQIGAGNTSIQLPGTLDNTGGRIATNGASLSLGAQTMLNIDGHIEHAGTGAAAIDATSLDSTRGDIASNGALRIQVQKKVTLDDGQTTAGNLNIDTGTLSNRGGQLLQTGTGATSIHAATLLDNTGGRIATNGETLSLGAQTMLNIDGHIEHAGTDAATIGATNLDSTRGDIASNGALRIQARQVTLDGGQTTADNLNIDTGTLFNRSGQLLQTGTGATSIHAAELLDNTGGTLISNGNTTVTSAALLNQGATLKAAGASALTIEASGRVDNSAQGEIIAGGALAVTAGDLLNAGGTLTAVDALRVQTSDTIDNTQGLMGANRDVSITAASVNNSGGLIGSVQGNAAVTATRRKGGHGGG